MPPTLDSQQVESLGRAALIAQLVGDGLEVAQPDRDAGIDLLAFTIEPWHVVPIQMKAATAEAFSVDRKYERARLVDAPLLMVYVWNARSATDIQFYAMTWRQAEGIAASLGWTQTPSWLREPWSKGGYATSRPSRRLKEAIAPHLMGPGKWRELLSVHPRPLAASPPAE
jgi:hypothetical protein